MKWAGCTGCAREALSLCELIKKRADSTAGFAKVREDLES